MFQFHCISLGQQSDTGSDDSYSSDSEPHLKRLNCRNQDAGSYFATVDHTCAMARV